jgi:sialate O-acetylesterase
VARRRSSCSLAGLSLASACFGFAFAAQAAVTPNPLFADHAVLQQGAPVPIWGTAAPGEAVTVEVAGQSASATAGPDGKWLVRLAPMKAGGPYTMSIAGENRIVVNDVLVGEVWVCGGQSNMERQLGLRVGQQPIDDWEKEAAAADYPQIRHFGVAQEKSLTPLATVKGRWDVATPETVKDFTAVGYFFGRDLFKARHVPVGLIHASWGGTPAEAWTSVTGLQPLPDFADTPAQLKTLIADPAAARRAYEALLETWFAPHDAGSAPGKSWSDPALETGDWKTMTLPTLWEDAGEADLNGVVWFRKTFDLPASAAGAAAELQIGMVDDIDTTWVNGVKVGATVGYNVVRNYAVPAGVLKPGRNVVAVRVLDTGGGGGIWGDQKLQLVLKKKAPPVVAMQAAQAATPPIDLSGPWRYRIGLNLLDAPQPPSGVTGDVTTPTILYNAMIAPLIPYAIRGVVWYQGEANVHREEQYRSLFPALIADWRRAWGRGDFPFLFVQIAPHHDMTPELRQAQLWTWQHTPKTAMVVTMDCGDPNDIHPTHKQPVGARLALAARALAYGERLEYSGPVFDSIKIKGRKAILRFAHARGGLVAKGGPLTGFELSTDANIAVYEPAHAEIQGDTVVVTARDGGPDLPAAVRYGWANVPVGNLFNRAGLPASPFDTDEIRAEAVRARLSGAPVSRSPASLGGSAGRR